MRVWLMVVGMLVSGCGRVGFAPAGDGSGLGDAQLGDGDDAQLGDGDIADGDLGDGSTVTCYGSGLVTICPAEPLASQLLVPTGATLAVDTSTSGSSCIAYTGTSPGAFCVVAAADVDIAGALRATGARPLVILARDTLSVSGTVDVSSRNISGAGAGANGSACMAGQPPVNGDGGPGGTLGGRGGSGGDDSAVMSGPASAAVTTITTLRGGCPGASGNGTEGDGGSGGGAAYLIAGATIMLSGTINASGAGGLGGPGAGSGGGGGGSGGLIGLDAPSIVTTSNARVFANGGGGGAGNSGADGQDATSPTTAAAGGVGASADGGDGAVLTTLDGEAGLSTTQAGGGGGGGAGVIRVFPLQTLAGTFSPPAS